MFRSLLRNFLHVGCSSWAMGGGKKNNQHGGNYEKIRLTLELHLEILLFATPPGLWRSASKDRHSDLATLVR